MKSSSLATRTLRLAALRIGVVSLCAGAISYFINMSTITDTVRRQLLLSTEQTLQHDGLSFREIRDIEQNYLDEFKTAYSDPANRQKLAREFEQIFYRHADGSYTQRPGLFNGTPLPDGRAFPLASATFSPEFQPDADIKSRLVLAYHLSYKYGTVASGRIFNIYGLIPEKGYSIYQSVDVAKAYTYSGPDAFDYDTYEFYTRGFAAKAGETIFTRMYWDYSNNTWMTTVVSPGVEDASGRSRIGVCIDVRLDDLMTRTERPMLDGSHSTIFEANGEGTLIYDRDHMDEIMREGGAASVTSLKIESEYPVLEAVRTLPSGKVGLIEDDSELIAFGMIPNTPWVLTVHYPKSLIQPAILQNLAVVIALGMLTLLVEIFIIRSILQNQVAIPLTRLIQATRLLGQSGERLKESDLPVDSGDEIGELARDFARMAERVQDVHEQLERKVQERTLALAEANNVVQANLTDQLTHIANRRCFDETLENEWQLAQRAGSYLMIAMIDIDWFKEYNDRYGHQAGDACLRAVAEVLQNAVGLKGDLVARYGDEEFAVIARSEDAESAHRVVRAIETALEEACLVHEGSSLGRITVSIGFAGVVPSEGMSSGELLRKADKALHRAKQLGRNRVCGNEEEVA